MAKKFRDYYVPLAAALLVFSTSIALSALGWYAWLPNFDKVLHLAGGFVMAWLALYLFHDELSGAGPVRIVLMLVAGAGLAGVLWEFAEYASGNYLRDVLPAVSHYFYIGDLADTLGDLLADLAGALLLAVPHILRYRRK